MEPKLSFASRGRKKSLSTLNAYSSPINSGPIASQSFDEAV